MNKGILYILTLILALTSCIKEDRTGKDLVAGDYIPDFSVTMNDGTVVTGASLREDPSCIMFFHSSCPDCRQILPVMQEIYDRYASKGLRFALISREEEASSIDAFWKENNLTMPYSAQSSREVYNLFAETMVPRIYICEKGGRIRNIYTDDPVPGFEELDRAISYVCGTGKE